ncbi:hypothetical protein M011DRAFT_394211 [Sporormia fimetaria CBS 119925]|uniref:F-box domain-containing protein n=1 Tax=Sporormia fimetaria CBS 119925 TaxID=1340428 RepID=A0A6A6VPQ8_9PLEO|nr:hypothetical protein M011DRAFT_394211 [Sporormia fimetaria CBS 119925]
MSTLLLQLPPEILLSVLSFLPIKALLCFSLTCHYSLSLASSGLHSLSLGIYTSRTAVDRIENRDPYRVSVSISEARYLDCRTLLSFHTALVDSVLVRYDMALRNLDLTLWNLTIPIANTLACLPALRAISIRIDNFAQLRHMSHRLQASQRHEQREAWQFLAKTAVWAPRLLALRVEGAELSSSQLFTLLRGNQMCRELWLCKCPQVGPDLWNFLSNEWETDHDYLRILGVMRCGGQLGGDALDAIGKLRGLQFLSLKGSCGLDRGIVQERNAQVWRIPELIPPEAPPALVTSLQPGVIEVDPLYLVAED